MGNPYDSSRLFSVAYGLHRICEVKMGSGASKGGIVLYMKAIPSQAGNQMDGNEGARAPTKYVALCSAIYTFLFYV